MYSLKMMSKTIKGSITQAGHNDNKKLPTKVI